MKTYSSFLSNGDNNEKRNWKRTGSLHILGRKLHARNTGVNSRGKLMGHGNTEERVRWSLPYSRIRDSSSYGQRKKILSNTDVGAYVRWAVISRSFWRRGEIGRKKGNGGEERARQRVLEAGRAGLV